MQFKLLGQSNLNVSQVAFGCMSLDRSNDNKTLLRSAVDNGINLFDTADLYDCGQNEVMVGKALREIRKNIYIATKVGNQWRPDGSGWDWNPTKKYILTAVEDSLRRLQTDYIDLYQLHGGTIDDAFDETLEAFDILKSQGKILNYGISSIRPNVIDRWINKSEISSIMLQYSLLDRRPEEQCLNWAKKKNIGILARGSLSKGLLANKLSSSHLNWSDRQVKKVQSTLLEISERPPIHTALRYVLQHEAVTTAVVGIRTIDQLKQVSAVFDSPQLTGEEYQTLQDILGANRYSDHLI
ncbi:MAG: aldo/keto reductase [Bacteroidota bacterium]